MNIDRKIMFLAGLILMLAGGCAGISAPEGTVVKEKETLVVYPDGKMELNNRGMNEEDVVIYPDGRGGERAAVKVRVPLHPDFYRDTIIVERKPVPDAEHEADK